MSYPGPVEYLLRNATNSNGLSSNPIAAGRPLIVNRETGRVSWDLRETEGGAQVGEQYAFQVVVRALDSVNGTNCKPETAIDFTIQIGCPSDRAGVDPSCFLCSDVDVTALVNQIPEKLIAVKKQVRRVRRKIFGKGRQSQVSVNLQRFLRRRFRKALGHVRALSEAHAALTSISGLQTSCAAKSDVFCTSTSNFPLKAPLLQVMSNRNVAEQALFAAARRGFRDIFKTRGTGRADKARLKFSLALDEVKALIDAIPDSEDSCGGSQ